MRMVDGGQRFVPIFIARKHFSVNNIEGKLLKSAAHPKYIPT